MSLRAKSMNSRRSPKHSDNLERLATEGLARGSPEVSARYSGAIRGAFCFATKGNCSPSRRCELSSERASSLSHPEDARIRLPADLKRKNYARQQNHRQDKPVAETGQLIDPWSRRREADFSRACPWFNQRAGQSASRRKSGRKDEGDVTTGVFDGNRCFARSQGCRIFRIHAAFRGAVLDQLGRSRSADRRRGSYAGTRGLLLASIGESTECSMFDLM